MRRFASLRRPGEFARVRRRGRRLATRSLTLYLADPDARDAQPQVGITVGKAVGGAVERNRLRRRIGAIVNEIFTPGTQRMRLVIVARPGAAALPFRELYAELTRVLQ